MQTRNTWLLLLLFAFGATAPLAVPQPVHAEDEGDDGDDEFDTFHVGMRIGAWYQPEIDFNVRVGGSGLPGQIGQILPTSFDAERDLSIRGNPKSEYLVDFDQSAILELEPFIHTRFLNIAVQWIAPFEYEGRASLTRTISFGGVDFSANQSVDAKFRQAFLGAEVGINIFNNEFFRISPVVGLRALAIDWEIQNRITGPGGLSGGIRGDTSDIDSPMEFGDWQVFPFPEVGLDVGVGYRSIIDVNLKVMGAYVNYFGYEGSWFRVEANATLYPISFVGIQLGYRFTTYDFNSKSDDGDERFSFNLDFSGVTFAIILRI